MMQTRTWPYGTVKTGVVINVEPYKDHEIVAFKDDESNDGFILVDKPQGAVKDQRGTITFTKGGPTGGHWKYQPAK